MKNLKCKFVGNNELRINNPQAADPLNKYAKKLKTLEKKMAKNRTDLEHETIKNIRTESKLYFDKEIGIYVPTNWITAALTASSFKVIKISKADTRGAIYPNNSKMKLTYSGMKGVKKIEDVVLNDKFSVTELIKSGQVTKPRTTPSFNNWSFNIDFDFDEEILTETDMQTLIKFVITRIGFGDFRPTYGRGKVEDIVITDSEF